MRKYKIIFFAFIIVCSVAVFGAEPHDVAGIWTGSLEVSGMELRIVFKISKDSEGNLKSAMDSPDQGAKDIPVNITTFSQNKLHLESAIIGGAYDGTMNAEGIEIKGEWQQSGMKLPLNLKRTDTVIEARRPQEPKPPFPYNAEEISYTNKSDGNKIAGTLTLPEGKGQYPAVIMITGSGAQDRNETILNHKPFLVIADYLTRMGIAMLRTDDRGVGGSTGSTIYATSADFAYDALTGVEYLKTRKEINPKQIGLIGHSEGGIVAPLAAGMSDDIAFIVLLAGPGVKGSELLSRQNELIIKAGGGSDNDVKKQLDMLKSIYAILDKETDEVVIKEKIHVIALSVYDKMSAEEKKAAGGNVSVVEASLQSMATPWFMYFLKYDPVPALEKVKCSVLALNGSKDLQVPSGENLAAIKAALNAGKNRDFTVKELPELNHLFQKCKTGLPAEYGMIEETFSPDALKIIGDWITERTSMK